MKPLSYSLIILMLLALIISCGPGQKVEEEITSRCMPRNLEIDSLGGRFARIAWNPGCRGTRVLQGFNIYLTPDSLGEMLANSAIADTMTPYNANAYPGDTMGNPNRETFTFDKLENSTIYFAHVRAVNSDGGLSPATNEVRFVLPDRGVVDIGESHTGRNDGYSFDQGRYCQTDDLVNDIYMYVKDDKQYLCSPSRLSPVNRATKIYPVGHSNTLGDPPAEIPKVAPEERVEIRRSDVYILETVEGHLVKMRMLYGRDSNGVYKIAFEYIFNPPPKHWDKNAS